MKKFAFLLCITVLCLMFWSCDKNNSQYPDNSGTVETTEEITTEESTTVELTTSPAGVVYGKDTGTDKTYTGLEPLEKTELKLPSDADYSVFSKELREHGAGVGSDGKPHLCSVQNQEYMDEHNFDALCYDADTERKIIYLTFDVGYENGYTIKILDLLKEKNVTAAFFCTQPELESNPEAIARMIRDGHIVGNHSVTHPDFSTLSQEEIISELQGFDDYIRENFGYSSSFFRFPEGKHSEFSEKIITDLGYTSVFWSVAYVDWDIENQPDAEEALDTVMSRIHPGAVYLLHAVSPVNYEILDDFIDCARARGYEFVSLSDYKETHS